MTNDPWEAVQAGFAEIFGIDPDEVEIVVEHGDICSLCNEGQRDPHVFTSRWGD